MTRDEAGRLQELWKAKYGDKPCSHGRLVDHLTSEKGSNTGESVCRECGAIFQDPLNKLLSN
jgi:hypothetical protein